MQTMESLTYTNARGESVVFGIGMPYYVNVQKDVKGISDLLNTLYSTSSMSQDGNTYVGNRIEPRRIEIDGKVYGADKAEQLRLRRQLLKILNPQIDGVLRYTYGDYTKKIGARVLDSPKFSHPGLSELFALRFECLDPFWRDETDSHSNIAQWIGMWEFPCEIVQADPDSMIFGYLEDTVIVKVLNEGDVKTGMQIVFSALGAVEDPELFNIDTREYIKINTTMQSGDTIIVDTSYGRKSVVLRRDNTDTNIYRFMDVGSTFMQLDVGETTFRYNAASGIDNLEAYVIFSQKYLGV